MALLTEVRVGAIHVRGKLIAELFPVTLSASRVLFERVAATVLVRIALWGPAPRLTLFVNLIRNFLDEPHSLDVMREDVAQQMSGVQKSRSSDLTEAHNLQNHISELAGRFPRAIVREDAVENLHSVQISVM